MESLSPQQHAVPAVTIAAPRDLSHPSPPASSAALSATHTHHAPSVTCVPLPTACYLHSPWHLCSMPTLPRCPPPTLTMLPLHLAHALPRCPRLPCPPACRRPWSSRASASARRASSRSCRRGARSSLPPTLWAAATTRPRRLQRMWSCRTPSCRGERGGQRRGVVWCAGPSPLVEIKQALKVLPVGLVGAVGASRLSRALVRQGSTRLSAASPRQA